MDEGTPPLLRGRVGGSAEVRRLDQRIEGVKELMEANDKRYEQRFLDQDRASRAALTAAKEATDKADAANTSKLAAMNEFRGTVEDQQRLFFPRAEAEIRFKGLEDKIGALVTKSETTTGKSIGKAELWAYLVGVLGIIIGGAAFIKGMLKP